MKAVTFKDKVKVYVASGKGGDGCVSFRREKFVPKGGPDGGDGGRGGHVYLMADKNQDSLLPLYYQPHQKAEHGGAGASKKCHGKNGADLSIKVPLGTVATVEATGEELGEVLEHGEVLMLAKGGKGGLGNCHFATATHQAPRESTPGEKNQELALVLELKLVADAALVGYPNAGKSTLLSKISHAHPKIASYPFTTLNPIIGTVVFDDYKSLHVADVPGLIDGAHEGVGLGYDFLRHIERTKFLLFIVDMAGVDGRDPAEDYVNLRHELKLYREDLDHRPYAVVANKMDLPAAQENLAVFRQHTGEDPIQISAAEGQGTDQVISALHRHFYE